MRGINAAADHSRAPMGSAKRAKRLGGVHGRLVLIFGVLALLASGAVAAWPYYAYEFEVTKIEVREGMLPFDPTRITFVYTDAAVIDSLIQIRRFHRWDGSLHSTVSWYASTGYRAREISASGQRLDWSPSGDPTGSYYRRAVGDQLWWRDENDLALQPRSRPDAPWVGSSLSGGDWFRVNSTGRVADWRKSPELIEVLVLSR